MTDTGQELKSKRDAISQYTSVYGNQLSGKAVGKRKSNRKPVESEHALPKGQRKYGSRKGEKRLNY